MSNFALLCDVASGLHKEFRERFGIDDYINGNVTFPDGTDHVADLDWTETDPDEYYSSMKTGKCIYKSGVVSPEIVKEKVKAFFEEGRDVLSITLSSAMSATYNNYLMVKKELEEQYPGRTFAVVDSRRFSTPTILMYKKASEMRAQGCSIEETAKWIEENRDCFRQSGPMNDLKFLARTGRISSTKAFFGNIVGINSLGDFAPAGMSQVLANAKGTKTALKATIEYMKQTIINPEDQLILVGHTYRQSEAEQLKAMIEEQIKPKEIIITRVDMSCGANVGPGMVAAYYFGKKASEGLVEETALMNSIIEKLK